MQVREILILDDAYYDHSDPKSTKAYVEECYRANRGDSIRWACERCKDDEEMRSYVFELRRDFRSRFKGVFVEMLNDNEDPNHFFVMLGQEAEKGDPLAKFICEKLKADLNLDLMPSLFDITPPNNPRPPKKTIRIPES